MHGTVPCSPHAPQRHCASSSRTLASTPMTRRKLHLPRGRYIFCLVTVPRHRCCCRCCCSHSRWHHCRCCHCHHSALPQVNMWFINKRRRCRAARERMKVGNHVVHQTWEPHTHHAAAVQHHQTDSEPTPSPRRPGHRGPSRALGQAWRSCVAVLPHTSMLLAIVDR